MHVVAHQPSAQKHRVRCDVRASSLLDTQGGNVKSLPMLALNHVMRDDGVVTSHKLGDGIAERGALAQRDIVLNYGGLALLLRHNQIARMAHERRVTHRRDE